MKYILSFYICLFVYIGCFAQYKKPFVELPKNNKTKSMPSKGGGLPPKNIKDGGAKSDEKINEVKENYAIPAKYQWKQTFDIDTASIKTSGVMGFYSYEKMNNEIKSIELHIEDLYKNDEETKAKTPFETTVEYLQRIESVKKKYSQILYDQTKKIKEKLFQMNQYQYTFPTDIKIDFNINNYDADNASWKIHLIENDKSYDAFILLSPTEAKKLWYSLVDIKIYELKRFNPQLLPTILINYKDQNGVITLQKQVMHDDDKNEENKIFTKVEVDASYAGGEAAWRRYLSNNLDAGVPGNEGAPAGTYTVIVRFIVAKDGSISDVQAETNYGYGMEQASVRAIKKSGMWTPATQNGRNVTAYKRQQITWVVQE